MIIVVHELKEIKLKGNSIEIKNSNKKIISKLIITHQDILSF